MNFYFFREKTKSKSQEMKAGGPERELGLFYWFN